MSKHRDPKNRIPTPPGSQPPAEIDQKRPSANGVVLAHQSWTGPIPPPAVLEYFDVRITRRRVVLRIRFGFRQRLGVADNAELVV